MKKNYVAPMSINVQLDPLMVSFGIASASPTSFSIGDPVIGTEETNPVVIK